MFSQEEYCLLILKLVCTCPVFFMKIPRSHSPLIFLLQMQTSLNLLYNLHSLFILIFNLSFRITIRSRCRDACLTVDAGTSYVFNDGALATLEMFDEDSIKTIELVE